MTPHPEDDDRPLDPDELQRTAHAMAQEARLRAHEAHHARVAKVVDAVHAAFLQVGTEAELSLDEGLNALGMHFYATLRTAYACYEAQGIPYPEGRLFYILGKVVHALAHAPSYMDPQSDEWMPGTEPFYPIYDGGPELSAIATLCPWEPSQASTPDHL
jgi:hypothetical protein